MQTNKKITDEKNTPSEQFYAENEPISFDAMSNFLESLIKKHYESVKKKEKWYNAFSVFSGNKIPSISIKDYLKRFYKYLDYRPQFCNKDFIRMVIYINRYLQNTRECLNGGNVHRLLIVSCSVSSKFWDDHSYKNKYMSKVGGFDQISFNKMEKEFLRGLDWDLSISKERYEQYEKSFLGFVEAVESVKSVKGSV